MDRKGGHAYKNLQEFVIALSGSFDVLLDDGNEKKTFSLNRSYYGLYIPKMIWRSMENFSTNALCYILASSSFDHNDYIRDYEKVYQDKDSKTKMNINDCKIINLL